MRIDTAGARTWLFAAAALWAVCVWVLAVAGLGGRVGPLPEDPALLQSLPQGDAPAGERLGPLAQYAHIVDRPLFASDRQHRPFFLEPQGEDDEPPNDFDVVLTSVLITPTLEMAIVQPTHGGEAMRFKVGESTRRAPGWTLTSVEPRSAVFVGPAGERALQLRVFDGVGGEPPTPMASTGTPTGQARPAAEAGSGPEPVRRPPPLESDGGVIAEAGTGTSAEDGEATPASQAESIRSRIEARRARLREDL